MRHIILLLLSATFLFHPLEGEASAKKSRDKARKKERVAELVKRLKKGERIPREERYLYRAALSGADLFGADLFWGEAVRADLSGADLRGASYDDKTVFPAGFDPKSAGMVKAGVKKESAVGTLSIPGCGEGCEITLDGKTITCPNGYVYKREDSPILDALRSHGKEQIVPLLPLGHEDAGGGAIGQ